jgi:serine/threonine protein kinase
MGLGDLLGLDNDRFHFSNRTDIWTLGCTFFELVSKKRAFSSDFDTVEYARSTVDLSLPEFEPSSFMAFVVDMLQRKPSDRPDALSCLTMFQSFYWCLQAFVMGGCEESLTLPNFQDWRKLVAIHQTPSSLLVSLQEWCDGVQLPGQARAIARYLLSDSLGLTNRSPINILEPIKLLGDSTQTIPAPQSAATPPLSQVEVLHTWNTRFPSLVSLDNALMNFVRNDWKDLIKLFELRYNNETRNINHPSTRGQYSAAYQCQVGAGRYGDVYQA